MPAIENDFLRVDLHPDGTFDLLDKKSGRLFKDLHRLEDSLDCGDEYNFRIPDDDVFSHPQADATRIGPIEDNGVFSQCRVETELKVRDTRLPVTYILRLGRRSRRLEIGLRLKNNADNHRLRVLFPTDTQTDTAVADGQFDHVERSIEPTAVWQNPSDCQPQQAFAAVADKTGGLLVANRGLPEYEVLRDGRNTLALTLLRAVGELGDWGVFPTPQAQCHGPFACEYALVPCSPDLHEAAVQAYQFNAPTSTAQTGIHAGALEWGADLVSISPAPLVLSALKKADGRDSLVLRFYNPATNLHRARIDLGLPFAEAYLCDLGENRLERLYPDPAAPQTLEVPTPPKTILTIELT